MISVKTKRKVPLFFIISSALFAVSTLLVVIARASRTAADLLTDTVGAAYRRALAFVSDFIPFSLFEAVIALLPVLVALIIFLVNSFNKKE